MLATATALSLPLPADEPGQADAAPVSLRCDNVSATIETAHPATAELACAGAGDAIAFLNWLPRTVNGVPHIELSTKLPDGLRPDAVGCYAVRSRRLVVLELSRFLQRESWFGVPVSERMWRAVVAHEVAHALVGCFLQGRALPGAAHEYIAYVTMFATLDDATRSAALAAMPGEGLAHDAEINDFRYALDPMRFGADAYRHWLRQPDRIDFLRNVLRGSIAPEMPP